MGLETNIEWCDVTINAWEGCTQISPACDFCYAMKRAARFVKLKDDTPNPNGVVWNGPPRKVKAGIRNLRIANQRAQAAGRVDLAFLNSLSDTFDKNAEPDWRAELFAEVRRSRSIHAMVLTKRIGNAVEMVEAAGGWPENASLGATFCNQEEVDRDMRKLIDAKRRLGVGLVFASIEPILGPITLLPWLFALDYVIVGGESGGAEARPMQPAWARVLRDQCATAGVAFMFKQWGSWAPEHISNHTRGVDQQYLSRDWYLSRLGKDRAGRTLDGRTHDDRLPIARLSAAA